MQKTINKKVSKEEFDKFLADYPNKLEQDTVGFVDPPQRQFNDFSDGKVWPESVVAFIWLNSLWDPNTEDEYVLKVKTETEK